MNGHIDPVGRICHGLPGRLQIYNPEVNINVLSPSSRRHTAVRVPNVRLKPIRPFAVFGVLALTAGCVHVPPAPVDLTARAAARVGGTLDLAEIGARAAALAPGEARPAGGLDRLTVFAAILIDDPRVIAARSAVEVARRDAHLAHKAASPTLSLTSDYTNDPSMPSPWQIGATANVQLDFGGRKAGRIRAADLGIVAAGYDLIETVWTERGAATRGLVDVMAGARQNALGAELVTLLDTQLGAMQRRVDAGEMAALTLTPVRAARAAAARARDDASARIAGGRAALATVLGVPVASLQAQMLVWPDFADVPPSPAVTPDQVRAALVRRADVLQKLVAYDQAEAALRVEVAKQLPQISLGPGYSWQGGLVNIPFAINLQAPSFDLNRSAIAAAEAHRAAAGLAIETALADAQGAIDSAASERHAAEAALARLMTEELPQTRRAADRADVQLRLGAIDRADWAAAKAADVSAQLAAVDALTRLRLAQIALEDALRRPLDGPETRISVRTDPALAGETQP
jgi:CRISPR system Cascade subunit CasA